MMWGSGATLLPTSGDAPAMEGPGVKEVLTMLHDLWTAGAIPESAEADTGSNFMATFESGVIGMQGSGGFAIASLKANHPEIDFGITPIVGHQGWRPVLLRRRRRDRHPDRLQACRPRDPVHPVGTDRRGPARRASPRTSSCRRARTWPTTSTSRPSRATSPRRKPSASARRPTPSTSTTWSTPTRARG